MIYLDNNATTAIDPQVQAAMAECFALGPLNPSSQHAQGRAARDILESSIEQIGCGLGSDLTRPGGDRLIITSGGTEANNLAINGLGDAEGAVVVSRIEHPSVLAVAEQLARRGTPIHFLAVDAHGVIDLDRAADLIQPPASQDQPRLVSVMSANNETGVVQPIRELSGLCAAVGVPLHVDGTQSIGKVPFDVIASGATAVTFTPHKFHGPVGVGGLWLRAGQAIRPLLVGGQQQLEGRGGTEPVALVAGMAAALKIACEQQPIVAAKTAALRGQLESEFRAHCPGVVIQGDSAERLPTTTCASFVGADRQSMLMALDMAGVSCSSGSACSSGSSPPSHVLQAMRRPEPEISSALRFGTSKFSTTQEISLAAEHISRIYQKLRR